MANYIQFSALDGETMLVQIEEPTASTVGRVGIGEAAEKVIGKAQESFKDALRIVGHNAEAFIEEVRRLACRPDEMEVTFGLKASGEFGNFAIAKAVGEANYAVKLKWTTTIKP